MNETILITGYNGALAKRLTPYLKEKYSLVYLSSRKKSVNNKDIFYWNMHLGSYPKHKLQLNLCKFMLNRAMKHEV